MADKYDGLVVVAEMEWEMDYRDYEQQKISVCCMCGHQGMKCSRCGHQNRDFCCGHDNTNCSSCKSRQIILAPSPLIVKQQSLKMGTIEWKIAFKNMQTTMLGEPTKMLEFTCQPVVTNTVKEVHMELVHYYRWNANESYEKKETERLVFTRLANSLTTQFYWRKNLFTIRILKSRSMFPDFTLENIDGRRENKGKLRVGDKVFHINKQLLAKHSEVFDRMFNSKFKEATQEEIELKHEQADPTIFHDFLLLMCVKDTLPNPKNIAALCDLANMYEVNVVRNKCQRHLAMCREMPIEQRYLLAGLIGNEKLKNSIMNEANPEEAKRIIAALSKKAFSSC